MHNISGVCLRIHMLIENMLQCTIFLYFALSTLTEHMHRQPVGITAQKQLQLKHQIASCQEEADYASLLQTIMPTAV